MKKFFGFFKIPLQVAIGGYAAFILVAITIAAIEHHTEGDDDFLFCGDLEIMVSI
jgi:hypothetical protein